MTLFSCLCVTEGRAAFMPWLLWGFQRQTWPDKELVIVDSSPAPATPATAFAGHGPVPVRVMKAPPGTGVPAKRNQALRAARGRYVAWFDDDDWQHPQRLQRLAEALDAGALAAGACTSWFVDLFGGGVYRHPDRRNLIFNAAGFTSATARAVRFDERVARASDAAWMNGVRAAAGPRTTALRDAVHTFWLCHDDNLSNPRGRRPLCFPVQLLRQAVGAAAWADTDQHLEALRARVRPGAGRALTP